MSGNPDKLFNSTVKTLRVEVGDATQDYAYDTAARGNSLGEMRWQLFTLDFVATSSMATLSFLNTMGIVREGPALDNVSVVAVPEPGAAALLLTGFAGATIWRKSPAGRKILVKAP